jgi:hypothetical protein
MIKRRRVVRVTRKRPPARRVLLKSLLGGAATFSVQPNEMRANGYVVAAEGHP